jgi:hypothetical protein
MMKTNFAIASLLTALSFGATAAEVDVEITNLTQGMYFTPLLVTAHSVDNNLFTIGDTATPELQAMAEGGSIAGLMANAEAAGANIIENPAGGLLMPANKAMATFMTDEGNMYLSVTGMMLPTNDGFVGLDSWKIPSEAGTYTIHLNAYDAGTEANDEIRGSGAPGEAGMPVPPPLEPMLGMNGSGVTSEETNTSIHIHRGNLGDDMADAGKSDTNNTIHRWLNPVAKLTVTVK